MLLYKFFMVMQAGFVAEMIFFLKKTHYIPTRIYLYWPNHVKTESI